MLDYGVYLSKQIRILQVGNKIITFKDNKLTLTKSKLRFCPFHPPRHNYITKIIDDPKKVLKLNGPKKINFQIYFQLKHNHKVTENCGGKQRKIVKILNLCKKEWMRLYKKSQILFFYLCFKLKVDPSLEFGIRKHKYLRKSKFGFIAANLHSVFCEENLERENWLDEFGMVYEKMKECVFGDKLEVCKIEHPFYHEINAYNEFVISGKLDNEKYKFETLNERGIRDYLLKKLE